MDGDFVSEEFKGLDRVFILLFPLFFCSCVHVLTCPPRSAW